jgi:ABC-type polysaccharide/polyol phosphate transport system ATPase subunit
MNNEVIKLENISKQFYLHGQSGNLFDTLFQKVLRRQHFFALKNINLTINKGDSIGLIGKNGAGKTVLLKIISGILYPSFGSVIVKERISSIFGYAAGIHPELSGRENIFLYGSLLGIKMNLINRCFNDMVDFSEISDFLDTKIKYYSMGMKIRLAFSVLAFLKPDILILDEALAPGDAGFIKKAHEKVLELRKQGVTLIITSHSDNLLREFCDRAIVLEKGQIAYNGGVEDSISYYRNIIIKQPEQLPANAF